MNENQGLVSSVLLIAIIGSLALTASAYVYCKDFYTDEFLDLALARQSPILPVFALHLNNHPYLLYTLKGFYFKRIDLLTVILRC